MPLQFRALNCRVCLQPRACRQVGPVNQTNSLSEWHILPPTYDFYTFCIPPSDVADRASVTFTLVLTVTAPRLVVSDSLPKLSYTSPCLTIEPASLFSAPSSLAMSWLQNSPNWRRTRLWLDRALGGCTRQLAVAPRQLRARASSRPSNSSSTQSSFSWFSWRGCCTTPSLSGACQNGCARFVSTLVLPLNRYIWVRNTNRLQ